MIKNTILLEAREYRLKNKDKIKDYRLENKETKRLLNKEYYIKNKKKIREQDKEYRLKNKEKIKLQRKRSYIKNKEKHKKYGEEYRLKNKDFLKKYYIKNKDLICFKRRKFEYDIKYGNNELSEIALISLMLKKSDKYLKFINKLKTE